VKTAVIILFHGSRAEGSGAAVRRIIAEVRQRGGYDIVEEAYLQHSSPLLGEILPRCIQQHAEQVVIVPFFMQSGAHVTKDIPGIVDEIKKQYPGIEINITEVVGAHALMPDIVLDLVKKSDNGVRMNNDKEL
jgi:sirohydrochlorin ferrochelatase